jgi:hypothetical protein
MISSEVQRTLVKSPPELWAELSDPEALARHLGELGEVRITRAEPEKLVEWEAEDTTGTIAIKPSGWGTRVTLTVSRELSLQGSPPTDDPDAPAAFEATGEARPEGEARTKPDAHVEPTASQAPEDHAEPEPGAGTASTPEPAAGANAARGVPLPPATAAGAMASWAHQESEWRSPPATPPTADPELEIDHPEREGAEQPLEESLGLSPDEPAVPPRRGFLSRLFGRRRLARGPSLAPSDRTTPDAELSIAREAARRRLEATLAQPTEALAQPAEDFPQPALAAQPDLELQTASPEAVCAEEKPETFKLPEPAGAAGEDQADETPEPIGAAGEDEAPALSEPISAADEDKAPAVSEPVGATGEDEAQGAPESVGVQAEHEPERDLGSELLAAEETATEEVRAVLTAVLDRLGAAHHRPFSRG